MDTLLWAVAVNVALAALLAIPAALASRFLRHRPAVVHGLWVLVLLKLVTPPFVEVPLVWVCEEPMTNEPVVAEMVVECPGPQPAMVPDPEPELPPTPVALPTEPEPTPMDWRTPLVVVWLSGAVVVWYVAVRRLTQLERLLREVPATKEAFQERVKVLSQRLRLRRVPCLCLVPGVLPPLLLAIGRAPRLLIPAGLWARLTEAQRDTLVLHELAHLRRGDPRVRLLELVVLGLFWWYPLAWWACRALRDAEELCCDAWVVWAAPESACAYADTLVETVAFLSGAPATLPMGVSGAAPVRFLYRRLSMILHRPPSRRLSPGALVVLLGVGAIVLPMMPSIARTQPAAAEEKPLSLTDVVNRSPSCRVCHQGYQVPLEKTGQKSDQLHNQIVKLLDELAMQRKQVKKTEQSLREALKRFEEIAGKKGDSVKDSDKRIDDLEKKLESTLKELQELRRERRPAAQPASATVPTDSRTVMYTNQRAIEIPISVQKERMAKVAELVLSVSRDEGRTYEVAMRALPTTQAFQFQAPKDGRYLFSLQAMGHDSSLEPSRHLPALVVHVDTVAPIIEMGVAEKDGEIQVGWAVLDDNPDLQTLKLEYRLADKTTWIPVPIHQPKTAKLARFFPVGTISEIRLGVSDRARNIAEAKVAVPSDATFPLRASSGGQAPNYVQVGRGLFEKGKYREAITAYQLGLTRDQQPAKKIDALAGLAACFVATKEFDKVRACLGQITQLLPKMDASARAPWEHWLAEANKQLAEATGITPPGQPRP